MKWFCFTWFTRSFGKGILAFSANLILLCLQNKIEIFLYAVIWILTQLHICFLYFKNISKYRMAAQIQIPYSWLQELINYFRKTHIQISINLKLSLAQGTYIGFPHISTFPTSEEYSWVERTQCWEDSWTLINSCWASHLVSLWLV